MLTPSVSHVLIWSHFSFRPFDWSNYPCFSLFYSYVVFLSILDRVHSFLVLNSRLLATYHLFFWFHFTLWMLDNCFLNIIVINSVEAYTQGLITLKQYTTTIVTHCLTSLNTYGWVLTPNSNNQSENQKGKYNLLTHFHILVLIALVSLAW